MNVLYFINGSIGDSVMVLSLMDAIHKERPDLKLYILTPRNRTYMQALAAAYPFVTILEVNRRTAHALLRFLFQKNISVTPPTPGRVPLVTKLIGRVLAWRGRLVGFDDGANINRLLYTKTLPHDTTKLYITMLSGLLPLCGCRAQEIVPQLQITRDESALRSCRLSVGEYVVVHPWGSARVRSIEGDELRNLIESIHEAAPELKVVISGSVAEREALSSVFPSYVIVPQGELLPAQIAGLIDGSCLYIGVDTGITHIASALGARSLVLAHCGTPHWLPYYNPNATIVYAIEGDQSGTHEGREHLEALRNNRTHYLARIPKSVVLAYVRRMILVVQ